MSLRRPAIKRRKNAPEPPRYSKQLKVETLPIMDCSGFSDTDFLDIKTPVKVDRKKSEMSQLSDSLFVSLVCII